jgi:hypothetical protein
MSDEDKKPMPTGRELQSNLGQYTPKTRRGGPVVGKKNSPERLTRFLDRLTKYPHITQACAAVGLSHKSLRTYLAKSEKGQVGDGFDLDYGGEKKRFHEHYFDVIDLAAQMIEDAVWQRAFQGYYETLSDKGRVIYQIDPELAGLGLTGPDAYLLDENGRPVPERIQHQDPELMLEWLRAFRRDRWGRTDKLDVSVRGGVMVVGVRATPKEVEAGEQEALTAPLDVEFREVEDE